MNPNVGQAYVSNTVKSATPGQLIVMLYDGLLRFASDARDAMKEGRPAADEVNRCIRILTELNSCLRRDAAPELCDRLSRLYEFYTMELSKAMHQNEPKIVEALLPMIGDLRDAWREADLNSK